MQTNHGLLAIFIHVAALENFDLRVPSLGVSQSLFMKYDESPIVMSVQK
jgi:hypothetical protein